MKKIFLALAVLLLLVVIGVVVSIATFDVDRYRPMLLSTLEQVTGKAIRLERMALGWKDGLAIQLRGFAMYPDATAQGDPLVQVESVNAIVRLPPLLKRDIQISSVVIIRPHVRVTRSPQGDVNLSGLAAIASPAAASGQTGTAGEQSVSFNVAVLRIEQGAVDWTDQMVQPPQTLHLRDLDVTVSHIAPHQPMDIEARGALEADAPNISLRGRLTPPGPDQSGALHDIELSVQGLPLDAMLPPTPAGQPALRGRLTTTFKGDLISLEPREILRTISGDGRVQLSDAVIKDLNILREVFAKFALLPGLVERLQARLPQEYQAKFAMNDTVLAPVDLPVKLSGGMLRMDALTISAETFTLAGSGRVGFDGTVHIPATLRIDPALSDALVRSVSELQALNNSAGQMEIPLVIQGQAPQIAVAPDMNYLASKVIATAAADLLGDLLRKSLGDEQEEAVPQDAEGVSQTAPPAEQSLLGQFLQKAIEKNTRQEAPAPQ